MKWKEIMLHQQTFNKCSTLSGFRLHPNHTKPKKPTTKQVFRRQKNHTDTTKNTLQKLSALHTTQGFFVLFTFDSPFHFDFKTNKRNKAKKENDDEQMRKSSWVKKLKQLKFTDAIPFML